MTDSPNLGLPLLSAEQALKHVTHNEALLLLDGLGQLVVEARAVTSPPASPAEGSVYDVGPSASGDWSGHDGDLAIWTAGGWRFATPQTGWRLWDKANGNAFIHTGGAWATFAEAVADLQNLALLGVNASADTTNRFALRAPAALFNALETANGGDGDIRLTLNRESAADTASLVFQSVWSGRAEIGIAGSDDFVFKVSADGSSFSTGMTISANDGFVTFNQMFGSVPDYPAISGGVLTVVSSLSIPALEAGTSDVVDTISGGFDGAVLVLCGTTGTTLTFETGTGNLRLGANRVLNADEDTLTLIRRGGTWIELSFADNA